MDAGKRRERERGREGVVYGTQGGEGNEEREGTVREGCCMV